MILYMKVLYLPVCLCSVCVPSTQRGQKRLSDCPEGEQTVVSCHVGARNQPHSLVHD